MKGNFSANKKKDFANGKKLPTGVNNTTFSESPEVTKSFNDRFNYLLTNGIGSNVTVTVNSGMQYEGILSACNLESPNGIDVVLQYPKIIHAADHDDVDALRAALKKTLLINGDDVAELELKNVDLTLDEKYETESPIEKDSVVEETVPTTNAPQAAATSATKFKTDVDISRREFKERELQRWTPDGDTAAFDSSSAQTLEESSSTWDQFAVNEKKFGVKSTFDEHFYTTKINKNDPQYQQRLKEADKIAKEIESQNTFGNVHLAEDRGVIIDDSGMDEEDLYSGVDRRGDELLASLKTNAKPVTTKPNKYVPPTLRTQPHHMDPAIISSTSQTTKTTTTTTTTTSPSNVTSKATVVPKPTNGPISKSKEQPKAVAGDNHKASSKKAAQLEELRKFSQKFKVPYDVPKDMNDIYRRSSESTPTPAAIESTKGNTKSGTPSSPNSSKTETKAAQSSKTAVHSKKRNPGSFFGHKKPTANVSKKDLFKKNFNIFLKSKESYDKKKEEAKNNESSETKSMEPFFIEKPYFTAPTWPNTIEKSYKTLFPDQKKLVQRAQRKMQQRQMNPMSMGPSLANPHMGVSMGGMMGFPMGPTPTSPNQMMNASFANSMGMYMPFQPQPMFYPGMPPMMTPGATGTGAVSKEGLDSGSSPSPQAASPHIPPAYMAGAPGNQAMGGFGYPGAMPFQGMMGGNVAPNGMPRQNYHQGHGHHNHHNPNNHRNRHNNNNNNGNAKNQTENQ
ncbi:hypothetical protein NCAS_0A06910 [Naumovozyma castellii]|uniref:LsmAD domain-containing protein n=1 Tax=Naumovozyma castellii TaxID=27288 RepID=G0V701_NAUCA|nr:hypothetical protein NCAS_0A06910 [Naumovozyma castellii CBS 4309]CCC67249.1 hypothetical protein NCAS_0A06910 [Naumovozyma castellii CBS 4309]